MSTQRWRRKLALQVCGGALAAGAGYYGGDRPLSSAYRRTWPYPKEGDAFLNCRRASEGGTVHLTTCFFGCEEGFRV